MGIRRVSIEAARREATFGKRGSIPTMLLGCEMGSGHRAAAEIMGHKLRAQL